MNHTEIVKDKKKLEKDIARIKKQLSSMPEGTLIVSHEGKYTKYYCGTGHQVKYIKKQDRKTASMLANKKYLKKLLEEKESELYAVDSYLNSFRECTHDADKMKLPDSDYFTLLHEELTGLELELAEWSEAEYEHNPNYPERLKVKTLSGATVRSKSEALIETALFEKNIPHRYECRFELGGIVFYPDFLIRHPITGELFIWEHFGMLDNPEYARKAVSKLQIYIDNGYYPNINLIITGETADTPLDQSKVYDMISLFFEE